MTTLPDLVTDRLRLRQPAETDLEAMLTVFNDPVIAANTISIPHPYTRDDALGALEKFERWRREGVNRVFFIEDRATGALVGSASVEHKDPPGRGELGYVVGRAWRGRGYATEAARAIVRFAFDALGLRLVTAHAMLHNPASVRVLEKLGMRAVGVIPDACRKDGESFDAHGFEITRDEWARLDAAQEHPA